MVAVECIKSDVEEEETQHLQHFADSEDSMTSSC